MGYKGMNGNKTGNGFDKNPQNINRKGQPLSLKKRFRELHRDFEGRIWIDKETTKERTTEDGREQIGVQLTNLDAILFKLDSLVNSSKDNVSLNAIKFLWEQLDGKAKQAIEIDTPEEAKATEEDKHLLFYIFEAIGKYAEKRDIQMKGYDGDVFVTVLDLEERIFKNDFKDVRYSHENILQTLEILSNEDKREHD